MYLNKSQLIGHLGKKPELRETDNGNKVTSFSMCTTESYTNKDGEKKERSDWHNIVVWGKMAELCVTYLDKGSLVYVEGRTTTRKWQDKEGNDRYTTEVVANTVQFGPKNGNGNSEQIPVPDDDECPF